MKARGLSVVAICLWLGAPSAQAADGKGCEFLWPLKTEMGWIEGADAEKVASGATLAQFPGDKAIELGLNPAAEVAFPVTPTRTPKAGDTRTFSGLLTIGATEPAHIQVTLSAQAWIDVVQNGKPLEATGHTGSHDCPSIRKSVRFEVGKGPLALQISGAEKPSIRIAVRPAAD